MNVEYKIKLGDTLRPIDIFVKPPKGETINWNDVLVTFHIQKVPLGPMVQLGNMTVVDSTTNLLRYTWSEDDIPSVGEYRAEIKITSGDRALKIPTNGFLIIKVLESIS